MRCSTAISLLCRAGLVCVMLMTVEATKCTQNQTQKFSLVAIRVYAEPSYHCDKFLGFHKMYCDFYTVVWGKKRDGSVYKYVSPMLTRDQNDKSWPFDKAIELTDRMTLAEFPKALNIELWDSDDDHIPDSSDDLQFTVRKWHINKIIRSAATAAKDADELEKKMRTFNNEETRNVIYKSINLALREYCE